MRSLNLIASLCFGGLLMLTGSCLDKDVEDPAAQFARDLDAIDTYLAANSITAYKDITGLRFHITSLGTAGLPPKINQQVKVKYKGRLLDGTVFEDNTTTNFVGNYIQGWQRALPLLPKGTSATIFIPSSLAYGPTPVGSIPANSVLVFDVVMQDVILSASDKVRLPSDVGAIDKYLSDNGIVAVADTTGVRYVITQEGTGEKAGWFSKVRFKYTAKVMNGPEFFTGTAEPSTNLDSRVVDYINGMKVALTKLAVGAKGTFYIPSVHGFGSNDDSAAPVPPNSILEYQIELLQIYPE